MFAWTRPGVPGPFSLGDATRLETLFVDAGFADVHIDELSVPLRAPSFEFIRLLKMVDNSLDYSLGNTTKQALWLPTSRAAKYKAKQAVDAFCVRAGDVLTAGIVYSGELASFTITAFAALNVVFVLCWLAVVRGLQKKLHARTPEPSRATM